MSETLEQYARRKRAPTRERLKQLGLPTPPKTGPAILLFDVETTPMLGWAWHKFRPYIDDIERGTHLLCVSWQWYGEKHTHFMAQWDDPEWAAWSEDDTWLAVRMHALLDAAEIVVAFNGDRFDVRKVNKSIRFADLGPPSPYQTVDPFKVGRTYFAEDSHRLKHLSLRYHDGEKVPHPGGMDLWFGCMAGTVKDQRLMERYNRQDVRLLRAEYVDVRAWMAPGRKAHPNMGHWNQKAKQEGRVVCPKCGHERVRVNPREGMHRTHVSEFLTVWCDPEPAGCCGVSHPEPGGCGGHSRVRNRERQHIDGGVEAC